MQTLVKLMLRLTTNVATSPASSARSSSAAARISSIASGRVSLNSATSSSLVSSSPSRPVLDRAVDGVGGSEREPVAVAVGRRGERRAARHEGRKALGEHLENARIDPLAVHVLGVDAEALGQRVAKRPQPLADLQRARERVLGRDVVAVGGQARRGRSRRPRRGRATSRRGSAAPGRRRRASAGGTRRRGASCRRARRARPTTASRPRLAHRRPRRAPCAQRRSLASAAMSATSAP